MYVNNNQEGGNLFQRDLALRALNRIGFNGAEVNDLVGFHLDAANYGGVIAVKVESSNSNLDKSIVDGTELYNMTTFPVGSQYDFNLLAVMENAGMRVTDFTCPEIDADGTLTGAMHGFLILSFQSKMIQSQAL